MVIQETAWSSVSPTARLSILKHLLENRPAPPDSHCVQGSGIFLVGAGDRRQPYLSPVRCSSGMFSALNEKTGTRSRIGLIQFYYNWEEDKKYLLVEIYLAKQK